MAAIPWPLSTSPGQKPQEGAGRLINCYAEPRGEGLGPVWHRAPGAISFGTGGVETSGVYRGGIVVGSTLYAVFGTTLYTIDSAGQATTSGATISGSDQIFFARNNNSTPQIVAVCSAGPFEISTSSVEDYPDEDVGSPTCVCGHDGYFMFGYGNGDIQASGLNSLTISPLNRARAESNPDGIVALWSYAGRLWAAGSATIEVWGPPINETGFPLNRDGYNITPGLLAGHAVAGFEPEFGNPPIYVASDHTVRQMEGYTPVKVSSPDLDRLIQAASNANLEALVYLSDGQPFWELSSDDWTWVFALNSQKWHERKSYLLDRSRFTGSVFAFDRWLLGDTESSGRLLEVTRNSAREISNPLVVQLESSDTKAFPNRTIVPRADFDFVPGIGIAAGIEPIETDPTVLIEWSDDGGRTWRGPCERKLGRQAKSFQRVTVLNTGQTGVMGRRWRWTIADPVHVGFMGGDMTIKPVDH